MKKGQSILIHAGSGGFGMAAITIAQKRGFTVFTTCSATKRDFLKDKFGLKDEQIGDSRTDSFVDTVLKGTSNRGVDVVLNQLAGPLQIASLRCLAPGGQFCEIGKYDVVMNSPIGQFILVENMSFHVIDLMYLSVLPAFKSLCDKWLSEGFLNNEIVPLSTTAFEAQDIVAAVRYMSQGKHTGKIVIKGLDGSSKFRVRHLHSQLWKERHLITGGLGGLGLALAFRLASHGSRDIVLVGRSGVTNTSQEEAISDMKKMGCRVQVVQAGVLDLADNSTIGRIDRIWHVATVYRDVTLENMTDKKWEDVVHTKVLGYHHLRQSWPDTPIVNISSISGYFGNVGQTNYAFANSNLDAVARRDSRAVSIRLGPVDNVGYVIQNPANRRVLELAPFVLMPIEEVLDRLEQVVSEHKTGVFGIYKLKPRLAKGSSGRKRGPYTLESAQNMLAMILGGQPDQYYATLPLRSTGLDSLSLMEVVHHIYEETGVQNFKPQEVNEDFAVQDLVKVVTHLRQANPVSDEEEAPAPAATVEKASAPAATEEEVSTPSTTEQEASVASSDVKDDTVVKAPVDQLNASELHAQSKWPKDQKFLGTAALVSTLWWVASCVAFGGGDEESGVGAGTVIPNASIVLNVCATVYFVIAWRFKKGMATAIKDPISCSHYVLGAILSIAYVTLHSVSDKAFATYWESLTFGFYIFDFVSIFSRWDSLVPEYRFFFSLHHALTFTAVGIWRAIPAMTEDGNDRAGLWQNDPGWSLGVMLWLSSAFWMNLVMAYRYLFGGGGGGSGNSNHSSMRALARKWMPYLMAVAFGLERVQRLIAYIAVIVIADWDLQDGYAVAICLTGIGMDALDIYFLLIMIQKQFRAMKLAQEFAAAAAAANNVQESSTQSKCGSGDLECGSEEHVV